MAGKGDSNPNSGLLCPETSLADVPSNPISVLSVPSEVEVKLAGSSDKNLKSEPDHTVDSIISPLKSINIDPWDYQSEYGARPKENINRRGNEAESKVTSQFCKIDINTCEKKDLLNVPQIGHSIARKILKGREKREITREILSFIAPRVDPKYFIFPEDQALSKQPVQQNTSSQSMGKSEMQLAVENIVDKKNAEFSLKLNNLLLRQERINPKSTPEIPTQPVSLSPAEMEHTPVREYYAARKSLNGTRSKPTTSMVHPSTTLEGPELSLTRNTPAYGISHSYPVEYTRELPGITGEKRIRHQETQGYDYPLLSGEQTEGIPYFWGNPNVMRENVYPVEHVDFEYETSSLPRQRIPAGLGISGKPTPTYAKQSKRLDPSQSYPQQNSSNKVLKNVDTQTDNRDTRRLIRDPVHKKIVETPIPKRLVYDGVGKWRTFYNKFANFADENNWSGEERKQKLCWLLEGKASDFYALIMERDPDIDFFDLVTKFKTRFDFRDIPENLILEFQNAKQFQDESISEWGYRVLELAQEAYKDMPDSRMYALAVRRFCQGVYDKEAANHVANCRPLSIEQAIEIVRNFQHNKSVIFGKSKNVRFEDRSRYEIKALEPVREGGLEIPNVQKVQTAGPSEKNKQVSPGIPGKKVNLEERISSIETKVDLLIDNFTKFVTMQVRRQARSPSPSKKLYCFNCKEEGHFKAKCPKLEKGPAVSFIEDDETGSLNEWGSENEA